MNEFSEVRRCRVDESLAVYELWIAARDDIPLLPSLVGSEGQELIRDYCKRRQVLAVGPSGAPVAIMIMIRTCTIHYLVIDEDHRRQGLGRRLIQWAKQRAHSRRCDFLLAKTKSTNKPMRALFESEGFVVDRTRGSDGWRHYSWPPDD